MTITGTGRDTDIVVLTIGSSSDTQIAFHYKQSFNEVLIHERTSNGIQLRTSPGTSDYFTIGSGQSLDLNAMSNPDGSYNLWIRAATGSSTVEILGNFGD